MPKYDEHLLYDEHIPYRGYIPAEIVDEYIPDYKVMIVDNHGNEVADLSSATIHYVEWVLNGVGAMEYSLPTNDRRVSQPLLLENEAQVWIDNSLEWWGFHGAVKNAPKLTSFTCEELLGYFAGRFVREDQDFIATEQRTIAWELIEYAQSGDDQDLNIVQATLDPAGVTMLRDRHYLAEERPDVLSRITAFPGLINGFDYEIKVYEDGRREFVTYHPSKGSLLPNHALEWGRNISDYTVTEEAWPGQFANLADVTGSAGGSGAEEQDKLVGTHRDDTSAAKYGEWQVVYSDGGQDATQEWLDERAEEYVEDRKEPRMIPDVTSVNVPIKLLGVVQVGDTVPVRIKNGRVNFVDNQRIVKIRWEPGKQELKLVFN